MAKLHEILAVESAQEKQANKLLDESRKTLGKDSLFSGQVRRLEMFNDEDKHLQSDEVQALTTTVDENLEYVFPFVARWFDTVLRKDAANQEARADIVLENGRTLVEDVPASTLLGLESKLVKIRSWFEDIPTLEPGIDWVKDPQERDGVWKTKHDTIQVKSRKDPEYRTVAPATKEHPAQVERVERTLDVGRYITTRFSGKLTPLAKAERITRIDELIQAVKKARMRANNTEVPNKTIGDALLGYVTNG